MTAGMSLDADVNERFGISATYMNNMYDISTGNGRDRDSSAFFFTLRFRFPDKKHSQ
jgi:hypothetical protein